MTPRLLLIFAHPDDESFVAAGLSRRYADAGAHIALVTATRGEAGSRGDPPLCTEEELPAWRESELREAAAILGIGNVYLLGYRDKHLPDAPPAIIREQLVEVVRRHRPHVVVTYDPNGGHGHADHVAISRFTMEAVSAAADPRWHQSLGTPHRVQRVLWTPSVLAWDDPPPAKMGGEPGVDFLLDISATEDDKGGSAPGASNAAPLYRAVDFSQAIVLLLPGIAVLKEWAYAGVTFAWVMAFISAYSTGEGVQIWSLPLALLVLLIVSYVTRPPSRRLI
jgi:LmbE family N-acetylglucosaminyl deacetylase